MPCPYGERPSRFIERMASRDRRPNRLIGYDYAAGGGYFVTICTYGRAPILAQSDRRTLRLTPAGAIVAGCWSCIAGLHPGAVTLDRSVVMPDHVHGILFLDGMPRERAGRTLSALIGGFMAASARRIRELTPGIGPVWQRSFHDRIIRTARELYHTRRYIDENPARWLDRTP